MSATFKALEISMPFCRDPLFEAFDRSAMNHDGHYREMKAQDFFAFSVLVVENVANRFMGQPITPSVKNELIAHIAQINASMKVRSVYVVADGAAFAKAGLFMAEPDGATLWLGSDLSFAFELRSKNVLMYFCCRGQRL